MDGEWTQWSACCCARLLSAAPVASTRSILSTKSTRPPRIFLLIKHFWLNIAFPCIFRHIRAVSRKILTNHALNSKIALYRA